jgi:hypothetical protein
MWTFEDGPVTIIPEGCYGFVYRITNTVSGREYIGKKLFYSMKTRQVKGKKKRYKAESDWQTYYGSNDELLKDIEIIGIVHFKREILRLCKNKGECTYYEAKYQYQFDVLANPTKYYNSWIMCKVHRKHLQLNIAG